jgi:hypothetical protein
MMIMNLFGQLRLRASSLMMTMMLIINLFGQLGLQTSSLMMIMIISLFGQFEI